MIDIIGVIVMIIAILTCGAKIMELLIDGSEYVFDILKNMIWGNRTYEKGRYER